jgi:hypothetical protein
MNEVRPAQKETGGSEKKGNVKQYRPDPERFGCCGPGEAMAFIDLSDPEEMLSLLIEYVQDEQSEADNDKRRYAFLSGLVGTLLELEQEFTAWSGTERVERLKTMIAEVDREFEHDPVVEHLSALVEELERINSSKS